MMTGRDVLKVIFMAVCIACSDFSWAQEDATVSARKIADVYINGSYEFSKGYNHAIASNLGHVIAFRYSKDIDMPDGWTGGIGGPTIFVDTQKMSVVGVMPPVPTSRPVFVGANMTDELASNVTSYFRKTAPDFDIANYDFAVADAGGILLLSVERKFFDRGIYNCKCALFVEYRTNQILGATLNLDYGDSMYYPRMRN
jgi:hypothetical protein